MAETIFKVMAFLADWALLLPLASGIDAEWAPLT
jgi:hypothetical protein